MIRLTLACAIALACFQPAFAQAQHATDAAQLTACIEESGADRAHACIGAVRSACADDIGEDAAITTGGQVMCLGRERAAWAGQRDALVARFRAAESASQQELLDEALEAGEAWLQARCRYEASIYEGGSLARVVVAQCARDVVADQALMLLQRAWLLED